MFKVKVKVNNKEERTVIFESSSKGKIDGIEFKLNSIEIKSNSYHLLNNNKSYNIEVANSDFSEKILNVTINGNKYIVTAKDKYDELLKSLGFDTFNSAKVNDLKAPMPGLVIEVKVNEGDSVKKGDVLLVLEAMKMENNIKSPSNGIIKKIAIIKGQAVEKNQILINF